MQVDDEDEDLMCQRERIVEMQQNGKDKNPKTLAPAELDPLKRVLL